MRGKNKAGTYRQSNTTGCEVRILMNTCEMEIMPTIETDITSGLFIRYTLFLHDSALRSIYTEMMLAIG